MGNNLTIDDAELKTLSVRTGYSEETIKAMHSKFAKLDRSDKGYVAVEDLAQLLDFKTSDLHRLLSQHLTSGLGDQIDFKRLVHVLSAFHNNQQDQKLRFLFDLCDKNKTGKLTASELVEAFRLIKVEHVAEGDLHEIAVQTVKFADHDGDGGLNFDEFRSFYNNVLQITI